MPNHHALVYIADSAAAIDIPAELLVPSLDVVHVFTERLLIADARQIITEAYTKPVASALRTIVITVRDFQPEAQHALLKLFEEPPATTRFIVVVPRLDMLLPTLRSRVLVVSASTQGDTENLHFRPFVQASYADRLVLVADYAKDKDTIAMEALVRGAEEYASKEVATQPHLLRTVLMIRDYFAFPGASRKMLLEALALALPKA
jgi:DNA polymerase III delta prime subunit